MAPLKFAVLGTGFWSNFQIAAWQEVGGVDLVAVYNRTVSKAEKVAARFNVPRAYDDAEQLLESEKLDFVDIITEIDAHAPFVKLAARHGLPVICQKPMAPDLPTAEDMVDSCRKAGVPFFVHENWRWQTPIRSLRQVLDEGRIGIPFRARVDMISGFPVFDNQPFLKTLRNFIITDLGSHILDVARVLFGEAGSVYCRTHKIHADIPATWPTRETTSSTTTFRRRSSLSKLTADPSSWVRITGFG
jgi:predicted dehydrogenase